MTRLLARWALGALVLVSLLACSTVPAAAPATPLPPYDDLMAMAGEFSASGNDRAAVDRYRQAAAVAPARKEPWQHLATMNLASGRPDLALMAAEEVLHRDPGDETASQVYIASSLEIARDAMQRLLASGATPGEGDLARAQKLVAEMALVFGDDVLIREAIAARTQRAVRRSPDSPSQPCPTSPAPELQKKAPPDPLEVLGGD